MPKKLEITGQRFNRLTVLRFSHMSKRGNSYWDCLCECGNTTVTKGGALRDGTTRSCGCLKIERTSERHRTHGLSGTPENKAFVAIGQRCTNPKCKHFNHYGGRGIKNLYINFQHFISDVGRRPSDKHTIDRIKVDGHYEPGNCRWVTMLEQGRNRRNNRKITFNGETLTLSEWSMRTGTNKHTIRYRLSQGWEPTQVFFGKQHAVTPAEDGDAINAKAIAK